VQKSVTAVQAEQYLRKHKETLIALAEKEYFTKLAEGEAPSLEGLTVVMIRLAEEDRLPKSPRGPKRYLPNGEEARGLSVTTFFQYLPYLSSEFFKTLISDWQSKEVHGPFEESTDSSMLAQESSEAYGVLRAVLAEGIDDVNLIPAKVAQQFPEFDQKEKIFTFALSALRAFFAQKEFQGKQKHWRDINNWLPEFREGDSSYAVLRQMIDGKGKPAQITWVNMIYVLAVADESFEKGNTRTMLMAASGLDHFYRDKGVKAGIDGLREWLPVIEKGDSRYTWLRKMIEKGKPSTMTWANMVSVLAVADAGVEKIVDKRFMILASLLGRFYAAEGVNPGIAGLREWLPEINEGDHVLTVLRKMIEKGKPLGITWNSLTYVLAVADKGFENIFTQKLRRSAFVIDHLGRPAKEMAKAAAYLYKHKEELTELAEKEYFNKLAFGQTPNIERLAAVMMRLAEEDMLPKSPTGTKRILPNGQEATGLSVSKFFEYLPFISAELFTALVDDWADEHGVETADLPSDAAMQSDERPIPNELDQGPDFYPTEFEAIKRHLEYFLNISLDDNEGVKPLFAGEETGPVIRHSYRLKTRVLLGEVVFDIYDKAQAGQKDFPFLTLTIRLDPKGSNGRFASLDLNQNLPSEHLLKKYLPRIAGRLQEFCDSIHVRFNNRAAFSKNNLSFYAALTETLKAAIQEAGVNPVDFEQFGDTESWRYFSPFYYYSRVVDNFEAFKADAIAVFNGLALQGTPVQKIKLIRLWADKLIKEGVLPESARYRLKPDPAMMGLQNFDFNGLLHSDTPDIKNIKYKPPVGQPAIERITKDFAILSDEDVRKHGIPGIKYLPKVSIDPGTKQQTL
ncbi:MAG: hypothetical protein HQL27_09995, partial [Candidatus Omnitrophica bacterium]|nr:hypothetical protein [Candidatus Omnitrophota bacterium]